MATRGGGRYVFLSLFSKVAQKNVCSYHTYKNICPQGENCLFGFRNGKNSLLRKKNYTTPAVDPMVRPLQDDVITRAPTRILEVYALMT